MFVAGAGAGGSKNSGISTGNASLTTSGNNKQDGAALGGVSGNGGRSNVGGSSYWSAGGAGWLTNGTGGNQGTTIIQVLEAKEQMVEKLHVIMVQVVQEDLTEPILVEVVDLAEVAVATQTILVLAEVQDIQAEQEVIVLLQMEPAVEVVLIAQLPLQMFLQY